MTTSLASAVAPLDWFPSPAAAPVAAATVPERPEELPAPAETWPIIEHEPEHIPDVPPDLRAAPRLEPVELEIVRGCHFKAKPLACRDCKSERRKATKSKPCEHCGSTAKPLQRQGCARCGAAKGDRAHIGAPPSMNVLGSGDVAIYMGIKARWQEHLAELVEASGLPRGLARIMVEGEITFPDKARRDQGNFRVVLEKALGDALVSGGGNVAGGWLEDDDWTRYEFGGLAYRYEPGVSRTRLLLFPQAAHFADAAPRQPAMTDSVPF